MKRVVITGLGSITPLGTSVSTSWNKLIHSKSGVRAIPQTYFDTSGLACKIAALVPGADEENGFNPTDYIPPKEVRKMDRFIQLAIAASDEAVKDSGLDLKPENGTDRSGVIIGSGIGGLPFIEQNAYILHERGPKRISPFFIPASLINLAAGHVSIRYGIKGINTSVVTACASGVHAICEAAKIIKYDQADIMIAGSSEAAICKLGIAGFSAMKALSTNYNSEPEKASRPWDEKRDGFVMGEGAGILILEEYEHAKKRGAKIYAEVAGYGATGDAYHIAAPDESGDGGFRAMQLSLAEAEKKPEDIGYINAHATSTPMGDVAELKAIHKLFQGNNNLSVSSTKSAIGHLLGAAGSVETIFTILALQHNIVPPTLNLDTPSENYGIDLVPHKAKEANMEFALNNSFGFGGTNASILLKKL